MQGETGRDRFQTLAKECDRRVDEAFRTLVEPYLAGLYRTAALILLDRDLARDAVQEALVRAYRSLGRFRPGASPGPWLHRLTVNEARRLSGRRRRQPLSLADLPEQPTGEGEGPEAALLARESRERLWQALSALSEAHRTVLVLRYFRELTEAEMAEILDIAPGTVKSRLHHARRLLEERLRTAEAESAPAKRLIPLGRSPHA